MTSYLLRNIPSALWARVARKAKQDGLSLRGLLLQLLTRYADGRIDVVQS